MLDSLIHCPNGHKYGVTESRVRTINGVETMWRRRKCPVCHHRAFSLELPEALALDVLGDD